MAAVKPVVELTVALVEISTSFQMLEYALIRLTDAVGISSIVSAASENINLAFGTALIFQRGFEYKNYFRFECRHLEI